MINFDSELLLGYNVFKERGLCNGKKNYEINEIMIFLPNM